MREAVALLRGVLHSAQEARELPQRVLLLLLVALQQLLEDARALLAPPARRTGTTTSPQAAPRRWLSHLRFALAMSSLCCTSVHRTDALRILDAVLELRVRHQELLVLFARLQHVLRHQPHLRLLLLLRLPVAKHTHSMF